MALGQWFSYNKSNNSVSINSVDFLFMLPFLRGRNFHVKTLNTLKDNEEQSLLNENEPTTWVVMDHHVYLSSLIEDHDESPIFSAEIELENDGYIVFEFGTLYVKYTHNESLKEPTIDMLKANGYFAANLIWDFCNSYSDKILLDFILCKEEKDIKDDFARMVEYNNSLDEFHSKF
jgi:hypothetical protein